ncbi:MAG: hypothetical protein AB7U30_06510 [Sulfuricellaceae bacterium]
MIKALKLQFLGFEFNDPTVLQAYEAQYPEATSKDALRLWQHWEQAHPAQFSGMYQFWLRRPALT